MKIYEVIQENDDERKRDLGKLKTLQDLDRAGIKMTGKDAVDSLGRYSFTGGAVDPEEIRQQNMAKKQRKQQDKIDKDLKKADKDRKEREFRQRLEKEREEKRLSDREKRAEIRKKEADKRGYRYNKSTNAKYDRDMGFRKDAIGRTLRNPRYYGGGKTAKGKTVGGAGSIAQGINKFMSNPSKTVADYYYNRIDDIKDFLNTRIDR